MFDGHLRITYIGGSTALLEIGGVRLLTDPTFDPAGSEYPATGYTLRKEQSPALRVDEVVAVDLVLLSHDHHADNLDRTGRFALASARRVVTTLDGAGRLGGNAVGLVPWQSLRVPASNGHTLTVTATPARHGPEGGDRGPVIGFVLQLDGHELDAIYVSGDTVWFDGVAEVARRFTVRVGLLFLGAARVSAAGPSPLTLTADEGVEVARAMPDAVIVPLHFEGWAHFSESRMEVERAFAQTGMRERLQWPVPGETMTI